MSKKKLVRRHSKPNPFLSPLAILAAITLGIVVWYSWPRATPISINLVGNASGTVTLALTPASVNLTPGSESILTLTIDGSTSHVTAAQIELTYDSAKLGTPTVTLGAFLPNILSAVSTSDNKITFTIAAPPSSGGITGSGTLATIKFTPPLVGSSSLTFTDNTAVTVTESQTNMLKSATDATITTAVAESSAEPSTAASAEPSVAPSTPANPQKPDKPTGLRSNCFDGGKKITLRWDAVSGATSYKLRLDQLGGNGDKSIDNIGKTQYDLDIIPDTKYSWWIHSTRDGLDSDEAKIAEVSCTKIVAAASPLPSPSVKPSVKPSIKPSVKPTVTPKPSPTTPASLQSPRPTIAGSLNDIFTGDIDTTTEDGESAKPGFFRIIALGWQAIFERLGQLFD